MSSRRIRRPLIATSTVGALALVAALVIGKARASGAATVSASSTSLGRILVNAHGRTLYLFGRPWRPA